MIEGLSHVTFIVRDIDRMAAILTGVLGAKEVYSSEDDNFSLSREKFFLAGGVWIAAMEGEPPAARSYNHVAFKIRETDFEHCVERVLALGLEMRPPRPRVEGRSVDFYDDDNHLFELHTGTLAQRLERYAKGKEAVE